MKELEVGSILSAASERAQADEYDSLSFIEGLQILVEEVNLSAAVTERGREGLRKIFIQLLVNRLRVARWLHAIPKL